MYVELEKRGYRVVCICSKVSKPGISKLVVEQNPHDYNNVGLILQFEMMGFFVREINFMGVHTRERGIDIKYELGAVDRKHSFVENLLLIDRLTKEGFKVRCVKRDSDAPDRFRIKIGNKDAPREATYFCPKKFCKVFEELGYSVDAKNLDLVFAEGVCYRPAVADLSDKLCSVQI